MKQTAGKTLEMQSISSFLAFMLFAAWAFSNVVYGQELEPSSKESDNLAGNSEVLKVMQTFKGRGALADGSMPTPPDEAVTKFKLADGVQIELVAAEPLVMQPLSMNFDEKGRLWVVQYRQYPFPAGLKVIRYDQYLRAVFDRVPAPPPNHVPGLDRITVFEDLDANGSYESHRDVISGLNIATSVLTGQGGIWVLNPPYLLCYPDANEDAEPDSDPVVHLSGFGLEDTHSVASSLTWGPDGWLYGTNGSTTTAKVLTRSGKRTDFEGQCVWRYHPKSQIFEIYAEGGGNTFSLEIDSVGRVFSGTNSGDTRGMYYPQGSYGVKNWGKHGPLTNPYAFGYFQHMRFQGDGDRFAQTFAIYEGGTLPDRYRGNIISANALHNRVWASRLLPDTSTFRTEDMSPIAESDDRWFRPVDVKVGPDGSVYMTDWYDSRLTHVDPRDNWHKSSGRIYRLAPTLQHEGENSSSEAQKLIPCPSSFHLEKMNASELMTLFAHPNKFFQQAAVRVLAERRDEASVTVLKKILTDQEDGRSLHALWTLYQAGFLDDQGLKTALSHSNASVRCWGVRLIGDDRKASTEIARALSALAERETTLEVRTQLACSAKRLPASIAIPILRPLLRIDSDAEDLHQPLLLWWALESHCQHDREEVLALLQDPNIWDRTLVRNTILERLMQRFALAGGSADWDACSKLMRMAPRLEHRSRLVAGLRQATAGRASTRLPLDLEAQLAAYRIEAKESDLPLRVRSGDTEALQEAIVRVADKKRDPSERIELIELLGQTRPQKAVSTLIKLTNEISSHAIQRVALKSLSGFDDIEIAKSLCNQLHSTLTVEEDVQRTAIGVLAGRPSWAEYLIEEVERSRLKLTAVPPDVVQTMRLHQDKSLQERIQRLWGKTRATPAELQEQIERVRSVLNEGNGSIHAGRELFVQKCGLCHKLFNEGGQAGPNLTGYERDNLGFLLTAIVDPSAAIREEYTNFQISTTDGRVLTGLIENQDTQSVTLRGVDNKTTRVDREDIEQLKASDVSLMPEGLLRDMNEAQIRDLFTYVTARTYFDGMNTTSKQP